MKIIKVKILVGIPASGKSTYARQFIKGKSDKWIIVNRDNIRDMLGEYWIPTRENLVTNIEDNMIQEGLRHGYNVIIDATNINPKTIKRIENNIELIKTFVPYKIELEYKTFPISLKKAIIRDYFRGLFSGRKVGKKIIKKFYDEIQKQRKQFSIL
jgi:predicted kinase